MSLRALARTPRLGGPAAARRRTNRFCVVGYRDVGVSGSDRAWVHWIDAKALVLWEPTADPERPSPLAASRRFVDLTRDVVPFERDVAASTFRVTRQWVQQTLHDCDRHGYEAVVSIRRSRWIN